MGVPYAPPYVNGHISATGDPMHFMFCSRVGFSGRRIERRYLRFEQIQDGGYRHLGKISSGDISATGRPIHFMFCSRVGFSGTADLMALFSIRMNSRWRPPPSWIISMTISLQRLTIYLYGAHRAVIFVIAQLSCFAGYCTQVQRFILCRNDGIENFVQLQSPFSKLAALIIVTLSGRGCFIAVSIRQQ